MAKDMRTNSNISSCLSPLDEARGLLFGAGEAVEDEEELLPDKFLLLSVPDVLELLFFAPVFFFGFPPAVGISLPSDPAKSSSSSSDKPVGFACLVGSAALWSFKVELLVAVVLLLSSVADFGASLLTGLSSKHTIR